MTLRPIVTSLALISLSACAFYRPAPLHTDQAALATLNVAILSADASKIERPFLVAQPVNLAEPLTPNALGVIAVLQNPDMKALRLKTGVVDAQAFAARLIPDPTVQFGADAPVAGPDTLLAFAGSLGLDLGVLRTRKVTAESAAAANLQVRLDLAWAEWQTAGAARLQGVRVLALTRQLVLAQASAASAENLLGRSLRAAGRGDISNADVDTRRLSTLDASAALRTIERDLTAARLELNKLLGLPPATILQLAVPPDPTVPPEADALVAHALTRRLDLQALRAGYGVAEADVHKAVLDQFPNLSLTLASARDTAGVYSVGPQVGFSLPLWNRNRGGIAIAQATRAQLRAEYDARLFQTRAEIFAAVEGLKTIRRQQAELRAALPGLGKLAAASARAAKRGDLSRSTAETTLQTLRDRQTTLASLDQQAAEAFVALELLSGGPSQGWTQ